MADVWNELGRVDETRLAAARVQAHHAVQWPARVAHAFVAPMPGDAHTNLGWSGGALTTHAFGTAVALGLRIADLTLIFDGHEFPLDGRFDAEARAWLGERLRDRGFDPTRLPLPPLYDLPPHPVAQGGRYAVDDGCVALAAWFASADGALKDVRARYAVHASPVRCWPHHFDIATSIALDGGGDPERARSVGVGLSPGDGHYPEPYYYVSPWPYPDAERLPRLPPLGHWHTQHFTAAIAPAHRIVALQDRRAAVADFLSAAVAASIDVLGVRAG